MKKENHFKRTSCLEASWTPLEDNTLILWPTLIGVIGMVDARQIKVQFCFCEKDTRFPILSLEGGLFRVDLKARRCVAAVLRSRSSPSSRSSRLSIDHPCLLVWKTSCLLLPSVGAAGSICWCSGCRLVVRLKPFSGAVSRCRGAAEAVCWCRLLIAIFSSDPWGPPSYPLRTLILSAASSSPLLPRALLLLRCELASYPRRAPLVLTAAVSPLLEFFCPLELSYSRTSPFPQGALLLSVASFSPLACSRGCFWTIVAACLLFSRSRLLTARVPSPQYLASR
ncbi:hypothetical protein KSP39_PZI018100 [Platanthera zijinensis]|uniref:Uncharacterized protein n=1 Tax=Platanthera zijinensis TaxID=2320716 RepID=A0AAP0FYN9_9ASPA